MTTECTPEQLEFASVGRRQVVAKFDGGTISSDGGALLLGEVERQTRVLERVAQCFVDHRDAERVEHPVRTLVSQRILALALGYEDLNDHDELRADPLLASVVGAIDVLGEDRTRARDRGYALAGKSTLNRLELTTAAATAASRYQKIVAQPEALDRLLVTLFLESHRRPPASIVLDVDATDDPLHGRQEGRFFHGYYRNYCYLPLYIFCGEQLLCARLRTADREAAAGTEAELSRIVGQIRARWPKVAITVRGDSGFCRESLLSWCEANGVDYLFGLAKNARLKRSIGRELAEAEAEYRATSRAARRFKVIRYRTRKSWSRERTVIGKAEHLDKGSNPRFVVTSLPVDDDGRTLYERVYCARGEMENRIKEQQLYLFADRTSCATLRANQLRLYFSSFAYVLIEALRRLGLAGTALARAQSDTIRLKLLKIGARVRVTVRKIWISLAESYPHRQLFVAVFRQLRAPPLSA